MVFNFSTDIVDSPFNIGLSMKDDQCKIVIAYLKEKVSHLCNQLNLIPAYFKELPFENIFTDVEFNKRLPDENEESFINKTFYPLVFSDVKKYENGRIDFHTKFCFTLDKTLTPEKTTSGLEYGVLKLGNKPVLYYVWVDIQEVIVLLKEV
jgi:hypothetical protein